MIHGIVSHGAARPTSRPPGPPRSTTCAADVESLRLLEGWVLTGIHPQIAIDSRGAVNHQPEFSPAYVTPSTRRAATGGAA